MNWPEIFQVIGVVYSVGVPVGFAVGLVQHWTDRDRWTMATLCGFGWPTLLLASTIMAD